LGEENVPASPASRPPFFLTILGGFVHSSFHFFGWKASRRYLSFLYHPCCVLSKTRACPGPSLRSRQQQGGGADTSSNSTEGCGRDISITRKDSQEIWISHLCFYCVHIYKNLLYEGCLFFLLDTRESDLKSSAGHDRGWMGRTHGITPPPPPLNEIKRLTCPLNFLCAHINLQKHTQRCAISRMCSHAGSFGILTSNPKLLQSQHLESSKSVVWRPSPHDPSKSTHISTSAGGRRAKG
jgi:hypothetical protein